MEKVTEWKVTSRGHQTVFLKHHKLVTPRSKKTNDSTIILDEREFLFWLLENGRPGESHDILEFSFSFVPNIVRVHCVNI